MFAKRPKQRTCAACLRRNYRDAPDSRFRWIQSPLPAGFGGQSASAGAEGKPRAYGPPCAPSVIARPVPSMRPDCWTLVSDRARPNRSISRRSRRSPGRRVSQCRACRRIKEVHGEAVALSDAAVGRDFAPSSSRVEGGRAGESGTPGKSGCDPRGPGQSSRRCRPGPPRLASPPAREHAMRAMSRCPSS